MFAVMLLVSVVVVRSSMVGAPTEYAQLDSKQVTDIQDDIAALKEVGEWSDEDEALLGSPDEASAQELELSSDVRLVSTDLA